MKIHSRFFIFLAALLLAGCATGSSTSSLPPTSSGETIPSTEVRHVSTAASWTFTPVNQSQTYSSHLTTVITQADALVNRHDSLITQALYTISTTRSLDTVVFSGSVISFVVQGNTPDVEGTTVITPIPFTGKISNHNIDMKVSGIGRTQHLGGCENTAQTPLKTVQRNIFLLPPELTAGETWTDSTSSMVCNGALPVTSTVIRTFSVIGESEIEGNVVLVLDEKEKTFSKGEGSQGQHRIFVESLGSSVGHIYVDRNSGQVLTTNTTNRSSVSVESSGRIQHFIQTSTEFIRKTR